jgi:hypothetical protein
VTDGVFTQSSDGYSAEFFLARPITTADLATLTERVRCCVVRWFRMQRLLDADAAADMVARENSRFSVDASVRITLIDRDELRTRFPLNYNARKSYSIRVQSTASDGSFVVKTFTVKVDKPAVAVRQRAFAVHH